MADEKPKAEAPKEEVPDYDARIRELEVALAASRAAVGGPPVPEHGGGVGTAIHETWSQADQELSRAGKHPAQKK